MTAPTLLPAAVENGKWTHSSKPLFLQTKSGLNSRKSPCGLIPQFAASSSLGSQLAPGAILTRARCLSFQIAGNPSLGNAAAAIPSSSPEWSRQHPPNSSKHQPTHNSRGQCSERNPIPVRVRNDADLRAGRAHQLSRKRPALRFFSQLVGVVPVARHPSAFSSPVPVKSASSNTDNRTGAFTWSANAV